jgi:hypothetical protein
MKRIRAIFWIILMGLAASWLTGCATDDPNNPDSNMARVPWNQPQNWEGAFPSTINQGR